MRRVNWAPYLRPLAEAAVSLRWYQRTRPEAVRHLVAPGVCVLVTFLFAAVWGEAHLLVLGLVFVGAFLLVGGQFAAELREVEIEATSAAVAKPEVMPLLARIAEPPSVAPPAEATADEDGLSLPPAPDPAEPVVGVPDLPEPLARLLPAPVEVEPEPPAPPILARPDTDEPAAQLDESAPPSPAVPEGPFHEVIEPGAGSALHTCGGFLDACDFAFDFVEQNDPDELEIVRVAGARRETVWTYARRDAQASQQLLDDRDQYFETIRRLTRR